MRKTLNIISALAIAATTALAATSAPLAVRKNGGGSTSGSLRVTATAELGDKETKGIAPTRTRTAGVKSVKGLEAARRYARMSPRKNLTAGENLPQLNGVVVYADNWGYNAKTGIYSLPTAAGSDFEMLVAGPNGSSIVIDDRVYTINRVTMEMLDIDYPRYTIYDAETGEELFYKNYQTGTDWSIMPADMDIDPVSGEVYAITFDKNMESYQLSKLTFSDTDVTSTLVAGLGGNWNALAFDAEGQLYGISKTNVVEDGYWVCSGSTLNKIDKATGAITPIGETGQRPEFLTSATIDKKSGRMFWTISPDDGSGLLAEVNLTTGEATVLKTFAHSEEVVGLYAPSPAAAEGAPGKVENLTATFPQGSLTGKVSFTAPSALYDGTPATGSLSYEITANGTTVASGTTTYGGSVEADVTLTEAGEYRIGASVSNSAGKSPEAKTTLYIGTGVPATPYATLSYRNGTMLLTWTEVDASVDGGYIDPARVTYTIKRYPDGMTVSTDQATTAYSEAVPVPDTFTAYYYGVTAKYNGKVSEEALSNRIALGEITPPLRETFDTEASLSGWTILDVNADRRMWMWSTMQNLRIGGNGSQAMDDWVITPALRLEAGRVYRMSFDVFCDAPMYPERIEVKMGAANTAAAMATTVVTPTTVTATYDAPLTVTAEITPEESGTYFIGFHGISSADSYMMNLDNVTIESGLDTGAPAAATNLTAVADPTGAYKATVSFTTPGTSIAGGALMSLKKVEVLRDGELCKSFSYAEPNTALSFTDNLSAAGTYTYTVYAYNLFGQGMPATVKVYVGTGIPAKPASASVVETANEGEVTVSWSAVTTDQDGNAVSSDKITYTIAENNGLGWVPLFEGLTTTSHTFRATTGAQDLVQYAVFAQTEGGIGEGALTDLIPVGVPFKGWKESFPGATTTTLFGTRAIRNAQFSLFDDQSGISSQDGDNGFLGMIGETIGDCGAVFSGKISLVNIQNPGLSFFTFNVSDENINDIEIGVREIGAADYTTVKTIKVNEVSEPDQWGKIHVPLTAYAGKTIQVQFLMTVLSHPVILLDNIEIGTMIDNDLAITGIAAPETATTGTPFTVTVTVANEGIKNADGYSVDLFANGVKADSKSGNALAAGQKATFDFDCEMHALAKAPVEYYAVVNYAADEIPANNTSKFATVSPKASTLPAPEQLKVSQEGNGGMRLDWNAPDTDKAVAEEVTLDFEDAESFAHFLEGWTFVDVDGSAVGGFNDMNDNPIPIPGILPGSTKGSFFIFDTSVERFSGQTFAAHSGTKYLAALFRFDGGLTDDWAISPELDGSAQTISFFAKSYSASYPEKIQLLYSTGSTDTKSFQALSELTTLPSSWSQISVTLPAGAKRFAIRSSSEESFMLMIDDLTFTPAAKKMNLTLVGYNIYRGGEKLNLSPVSDPTYLDNEGLADHRYVVTAVYDGKGESGASNEASLNSGIEEIAVNAEIYAANGHIVISGIGTAAASIHTLDGKTIYSGNGDAKIAANQGVYLVKAGKAVVKVVVK